MTQEEIITITGQRLSNYRKKIREKVAKRTSKENVKRLKWAQDELSLDLRRFGLKSKSF